jgi:ABC-type sugar transport system substrate-binding protein
MKNKCIAVLMLLTLLTSVTFVALAQDADYDCSAFTVAALVHFQGPYTQQLMDGAAAAAAECGAEIITGGPAAFDAQASVALFQDALIAGADAVVVVAFPSEFWIRPIDEAVRQGVLVSTYDVESPASLQSVHTAPKQKDQGRSMAEVLAGALGRLGFFLRRGRIESRVQSQTDALRIKTDSIQTTVGNLSGGNQQKVVIAKWLDADPSVVLLNDPTRGVDVGAKEEIYRIVQGLAD